MKDFCCPMQYATCSHTPVNIWVIRFFTYMSWFGFEERLDLTCDPPSCLIPTETLFVDHLSWFTTLGFTHELHVNRAPQIPLVYHPHSMVVFFLYQVYVSPLPFPLLKGWTRAGYQTWFGGEIQFQRWSRATDLVVGGHALHLVAVWSRATDLLVRGHALHIAAVFHCLNLALKNRNDILQWFMSHRIHVCHIW